MTDKAKEDSPGAVAAGEPKQITAQLARGPAKMGWTAWFLVDREGRALNTEPVCSTPEDKWHPWFIRVLEKLRTPYWGLRESLDPFQFDSFPLWLQVWVVQEEKEFELERVRRERHSGYGI